MVISRQLIYSPIERLQPYCKFLPWSILNFIVLEYKEFLEVCNTDRMPDLAEDLANISMSCPRIIIDFIDHNVILCNCTMFGSRAGVILLYTVSEMNIFS